MSDEFGFRAKRVDESYLLASSAFPHIVQFTDDAGHLRATQAFFADQMDRADHTKMPAESFGVSTSSSHKPSCQGHGNNIFMQAFYQVTGKDLEIDEKMEG